MQKGFYLNVVNDECHVDFVCSCVHSSLLLGNISEYTETFNKIFAKKGRRSWIYLPRTTGYESLISVERNMLSHFHVSIASKNENGYNYEVGFSKNVSSLIEFVDDCALYAKTGFYPQKENHNFGYHFHLINEKGRTNVITLFDQTHGFETLLGEYHADGHNKKNMIDVNKMGQKVKSRIYTDCYNLGKKISLVDYKKPDKDGFVFYSKNKGC